MSMIVSTSTKLAHLQKKIMNQDFQESRGLSNEVSYYILGYAPEDKPIVRESIDKMERRFNQASVGVDIIEFNVYQIMWKLLDEIGIRQNVFDMEENEGIEYLTEQLNNVLKMTDSENLFVKYMEEHLENQNSVIFLTGIGEIFPLIRAHKILNTMHQIISSVPVILFYPGEYNSLSLSMFGETKEDNYYRAFQIN
ncbi:DUF1788 domain-containing protein [Lactiplantibacillus plantarum]|uniref:DUF1788 domain-containing protein n=2 Tax=Lactobacillaceae TaxID=33958 RepID=UPI00108219D2|nr:DUF1788 domain-containing protein [Lactiplantibacillus plantarum]QBX95208.1 DUF1788 domain-containing protein [Lactiplantibacillus plantarum]